MWDTSDIRMRAPPIGQTKQSDYRLANSVTLRMPVFRLFPAVAIVLLGLSVLGIGCSKPDDRRTPGQQVDAAIAEAHKKAAEAKREAQRAGGEARQALSQATDEVTRQADDLAITAEVKARLTRDDALSLARIHVNTDQGGRVVLRGAAPDTASRGRATQIARSVDGVVAVDNELSVQPRP